MFKLFGLLLLGAIMVLGQEDIPISTYPFLMPNVNPYSDELYLCTAIRIAPKTNYYLVGFEPNATMHKTHHMTVYGCIEPGNIETVWNCGGMSVNGKDNLDQQNYRTNKPCRYGPQIVYGWARDASSFYLPEGVGFLVGENSPIKYLVLQVHYMYRFPKGKLDDSGVFLKYTKVTMPKQAGLLILGTDGLVVPGISHTETACTLYEDKTIYPFAFRTHTHALGISVAGYVVRRKKLDEWILLGQENPQLPQMFSPTLSQAPIHMGDVLAAQCTMNNTRNFIVPMGPTNNDEMCNFDLMYWVDTTPLEQKFCFSPGPPFYNWETAPEEFNTFPLK